MDLWAFSPKGCFLVLGNLTTISMIYKLANTKATTMICITKDCILPFPAVTIAHILAEVEIGEKILKVQNNVAN